MKCKLNKSKVEFRVPEMKYLHIGYLITNSGIKVDFKKVRATDMPAPKNIFGVKRIIGVVQYVTKFITRSVWILNGNNAKV